MAEGLVPLRRLAAMTFEEVGAFCASGRAVALWPLGSVEPHGPHLPLETDLLISEVCAERAAAELERRGVPTCIVPSLPYGVTEFAQGFAGAVGIPARVLTDVLCAVIKNLKNAGFRHVGLINNHLEPAHDAAIRDAAGSFEAGVVSVSCPLTRRWGRTLSDEFKQGNCHAGRYETSLVLAARPHLTAPSNLPALSLSLSDAIRSGKSTFAELGMTQAYTGAPSEATAEEGESLYARLVTMVVTEVLESI